MSQVTSVREVQAHDPAMGLHNGGVDSKVSRRTLHRSINTSMSGQREEVEHVLRQDKKEVLKQYLIPE